MTEPLRYIQVGTGGWGFNWCSEVLPGLAAAGKAVAVAAVDVNPSHLSVATDQLGVPAERCYTDAAQAFAENEADFAIVVVPPAYHESVIDLALAHGLDILCEKPIADSMAACVRVHQKVTAADRKMAVTMSHRFDQDKQSLEAAVRSGDYGQLSYVVHRFTHNCRERGDWGEFRYTIPDPLLVEGAIHHFDIHRALTGANAQSVYAVSWNPSWSEFAGDSTALVTIVMDNGAKVVYEGAKANASTLNGWGNDYLRVECESATLELDGRTLRVLRGGAWERPVAEELPLLQRDRWSNPWLAEMFCDWVSGARADHPTNIDDNLQCAALLFAAIESTRTGAAVDVQAFLEGSRSAQPR